MFLYVIMICWNYTEEQNLWTILWSGSVAMSQVHEDSTIRDVADDIVAWS